ncbi:unnamed protein product [Acanthoscelides obtectus]|uniref:Uncharacterized protein n=1 Tax=Acanthoscelides obtectus TaxID=200917 RepID=A0A9P0JPT6_ACAOB|nr:unnamed protein product [Acanthoscelides obtectus]CAK1625933.1 hypothetical protein AOBTE_LOCUS3480 [Acanthoscelides obtectus]
MLDWLEEWNDPAKFSKRQTSQTYAALHHTVYGLLELVRYCKSELHSNYILLELPEYPPTISVSREPLDYGDTLRANCSCSPSRPRATLTFYLNDIMSN